MATKSAAIFDHSYKAENDLSAKQYYFVEYSGVDQVDVCDAAADRAVGILQNKPVANAAATVRHLGISMVVSDGSGTAIAAGDHLGPNSSGKAVKKATADYSVAGIAMDASTTDGAVIRILMIPINWFRTSGG
jgi:hypothetical protein